MEEKILNEIKKTQKLMGLGNPTIVSEIKNLIIETSIKPNFNFPTVKAFNDFKTKYNVPNLNKINFASDSAKFSSTPSSLGGLVKHMEDFKPLWVSGLVQKGSTVANATKRMDTAIDIAKKIQNGTIKHESLYAKDSKGYFGYQRIPNDGNLRLAILDQYQTKYKNSGQWDTFVKKVDEAKADGNKKVDLDLSKIEQVKKERTSSSTNLATTIKNKKDANGKPYDINNVRDSWSKGGGIIDDSKIKTAWDGGWRPGSPIPKGFTSKTSTPKGTPNLSPSGNYKSGQIGYTIETTIDPSTGKGYDVKTVQDEFGSTGLKDDNLLLKDAWNDKDNPWRPGQEVPEKYQTETYKAKNNSEELIQITDDNGKTTTLPDIFKKEKWDDIKDTPLTPEQIKTLINRPWWDKVVTNFKAFWGFPESKIIEIRKLTLALEKVDKSSPQYSRLLTIYEKELKQLFKSSFNSFVNMRNYLNKIEDPQFKSIWSEIQENSDGEWLNEFGTLKNHVPVFERFWAGIKSNFVLFDTFEKSAARSVRNKVVNTTKKALKKNRY